MLTRAEPWIALPRLPGMPQCCLSCCRTVGIFGFHLTFSSGLAYLVHGNRGRRRRHARADGQADGH